MARPHHRLLVMIPALMIVGIPASLARAGTPRADTTTTTTLVVDTTYAYDLENEPSQCIGLLPHPNCGKKPQQAGDRGGALQYAVLALVLGAVAVIGTVIGRNVVRRDRALAESLQNASHDR